MCLAELCECSVSSFTLKICSVNNDTLEDAIIPEYTQGREIYLLSRALLSLEIAVRILQLYRLNPWDYSISLLDLIHNSLPDGGMLSSSGTKPALLYF